MYKGKKIERPKGFSKAAEKRLAEFLFQTCGIKAFRDIEDFLHYLMVREPYPREYEEHIKYVAMQLAKHDMLIIG